MKVPLTGTKFYGKRVSGLQNFHLTREVPFMSISLISILLYFNPWQQKYMSNLWSQQELHAYLCNCNIRHRALCRQFQRWSIETVFLQVLGSLTGRCHALKLSLEAHSAQLRRKDISLLKQHQAGKPCYLQTHQWHSWTVISIHAELLRVAWPVMMIHWRAFLSLYAIDGRYELLYY